MKDEKLGRDGSDLATRQGISAATRRWKRWGVDSPLKPPAWHFPTEWTCSFYQNSFDLHDRHDSVGWASSCKPKDYRFNSWSEHMFGCGPGPSLGSIWSPCRWLAWVNPSHWPANSNQDSTVRGGVLSPLKRHTSSIQLGWWGGYATVPAGHILH